jgi:hypothetical protein
MSSNCAVVSRPQIARTAIAWSSISLSSVGASRLAGRAETVVLEWSGMLASLPATQPGQRVAQVSPFALGEPAPDAERGTMIHSPVQAPSLHWARTADPFGEVRHL